MYTIEKYSTEKRAENLIENPARSFRRGLLKGGLAAAASRSAFYLPLRAADEMEQAQTTKANLLRMPSFASTIEGKTTLIMPQVEMGQGVYTAIAMILADELDADFAKVALEPRLPNDKLYGNPNLAFRPPAIPIRCALSGSRCARPARRAGHAGSGGRRPMAGRSGRHVALRTVNVIHADSGRTLAYGDLVTRSRSCRRRRLRR